jgi:hypothetical protein
MYTLTQESEHDVWKEWWYTPTLEASLQIDFHMTRED